MLGRINVFTFSGMPVRNWAGDGNDFHEIDFFILLGLLFMFIKTDGGRLHLVRVVILFDLIL